METWIELIEIKPNIGQSALDKEYELPTRYNKLKGISIIGAEADNVRLQATELDGKTLFPKRFPCKFFRTSENVNPNERFFDMDENYTSGRLRLFMEGMSDTSEFKIFLKLEGDGILAHSRVAHQKR